MNNVSDLIIRIKNAAMARRKEVLLPYSKMNKATAVVLQKEGFLDEVKEDKDKKNIIVVLTYKERMPLITDCEILSRPALRNYSGVKGLSSAKRKMGVTIVSTSQGIMTESDARKKGVGGELLFRVW